MGISNMEKSGGVCLGQPGGRPTEGRSWWPSEDLES